MNYLGDMLKIGVSKKGIEDRRDAIKDFLDYVWKNKEKDL